MAFQPFAPAEVEAALGRRYILDPGIAVGGQGAVFRATRTSRPDGTAANDIVALKLHFYPGQDIRIQREITAMESLSHPTLARLIEHGNCDVAGRRTRYIAYEFIEGQSLKHRLKSGRLLESEVLPIGRDVSSAIAALWARRIVHGDIKPSNIMLRDSGGAVLIDLGIASFLEEDAAPRPLRPVAYFSPGQVRHWGTSGYMSPEQARGQRPLSCASDIFSLGVAMLESIQGWHPTNHDQSALADGIRASERRLTVSAGLLSTLDTMLLARPRSRGRVADLSGYFQMLQEKMEEEFARGARAPQKAQS
jgi:eukaryotic-like serine/threonine-protein kinase